MVGLLSCAVVAQHIDVSPWVGEVRSDIVATVWSGQSKPVAGIMVTVRTPAGADVEVGPTGPDGTVRYQPQVAGAHQFRVHPAGRDEAWVTPFEVRPERSRWLWALVCVPLGAALAWLNLRRLRRDVAAS